MKKPTVDRIKDKISCKLNRIRCRTISRNQTNPFTDKDKTYVTIFHDYESHYSRRCTRETSYHGINRILDIETKYGIKATYNIVGKLIQEVPEVIARIIDGKHEIASHSYRHDLMSGLSPDEIERDLEETKAVFALHDIKLKGFRSPQSRWTFKQMEVYLNHGLRWSAENDDAAFPYVLKKNHSNCLFRMPVVMDDWKFESLNVTPSMMLENLTRRLDLLCDKNSYGAIGFHPWVLGKSEDKLNMFEKFISILSDRKDVTVCTFDSIYKLIIEGRIDS